MDQFVELFRNAAIVVGIEAARVWPQMVLLHWIKAVWTTILYITVLPLAAVITWRSVKLAVTKQTEWEEYRFNIVHLKVIAGGVTGGMVTTILLLSLLLSGSTTLGTLVAPEASLVKQIISTTGNK